MKRSLLQVGVCLAAAMMVAAATPSANGQGREYIVDSQVVSDTGVESGAVSSNYVGDMSASDAGCNSCSSCGGRVERRYGRPDLFYNYYTQGYQNTANAQMYISPLPVPPNVGHTFNTYQPFYPEEMLYWHKNRFHNYYDDGRGMNRTRAVYYSPPIRQAISNLYWNKLRIPR